MSCGVCASCGGEPFRGTLTYTSPAHGGWGVARMGQLLPESYQLFAGPAACGRHGALSACLQGRKDTIAYLYLSEDDIVSGGYERAIADGAEELLAWLEKRGRTPRVMMIFVTCLDDLLGTDHEALAAELHERHPEVRFIDCHMNPITTDTKVPPAVNIRNKIYSTLDVAERKDGGVNLIGSLVPLLKDGEYYDLLARMGAAPARQITDFSTFDGFQQMARSRLNVVLAPPGVYAAEQMEKKHGTPWLRALVSYDPREVTKTYRALAAALGADCPDLSGYEAACEEDFARTREFLDGLPVVLDGDAVTRPFDLARALLERGFRVKRLIVQDVVASDAENYRWLRERCAEVEIIQPQDPRRVLFRDRFPECLCIGYNSGYITGSQRVVPADAQQGHWGYRGVAAMLEMIRAAAGAEINLKDMVKKAGLVL